MHANNQMQASKHAINQQAKKKITHQPTNQLPTKQLTKQPSKLPSNQSVNQLINNQPEQPMN